MTRIADLETPALVLDLDVLEANIARMARRAAHLDVRLRPHIKTHKSIEIARLQRGAGARGLTVSTLEEARIFADAGFDDLVWAFPIILSCLDEAATLAIRGLEVVVDSPRAVDALVDHAGRWRVWIKVDCGYHRAGVDPESDALVDLARRLDASPGLDFRGILTHSGHAYQAIGDIARARIADQERDAMVTARARIEDSGVAVPVVSVGSTPAMTAATDLTGVDEARPGNYVFFDGTQRALGACRLEECALTVLTSVVSCQPRHAVVDAGALALSKDSGPAGSRSMGEVVPDDAADDLHREDLHLVSLSQEHGILNRPRPVGTKLRILPNHSCLAAACFDAYVCVRGDRVVDRWRIWRGRGGSRPGP